MNILFFWTIPFKNAGGVGAVTAKLAQEFLKRNFGVHYLSSGTGDSYEDNGVTQSFFPAAASDKNEGISFFRKYVTDHNIGIIINQSGIDISTLKIIDAAQLTGVKIISVHHNCITCLQDNYIHIIEESLKDKIYFPLINNYFGIRILKYLNKKKYRIFFEYLVAKSDKLVLLSKRFIPELKTYLNHFPEEKVTGIPNPASFDIAENVDSKKENRIIYVGRIEYVQKQVNLLLDLWKMISAQHPGWYFDIVGDGDALEDLKKRAVNENLQNVYFHGQQDPRPFLEKAKFFIMTSSFEGFGMVLVEAQAYAVVPFAFNCFNAIEDVIKNMKDGVIINPFDLNEYALTLSALMKNESLRQEMATNAQRAVGKYHVEKVANNWISLFESIKKNKV